MKSSMQIITIYKLGGEDCWIVNQITGIHIPFSTLIQRITTAYYLYRKRNSKCCLDVKYDIGIAIPLQLEFHGDGRIITLQD